MRLKPVALILLFPFVYPEEGDYRVYQNTGTTKIYVTAVPKKLELNMKICEHNH
jgi:hypothetical protein